MVNRLSAKGLLKRVPDEIDSKIAYIELDGKAKEMYMAQRRRMGESVSKVIAELGEDKAKQMLKHIWQSIITLKIL